MNLHYIDLQFFAGEKTEPATPKKRRDVRKKGQVFKSQDLLVAATTLVGFGLLPKFLEFIRDRAVAYMRTSLTTSLNGDFTVEFVSQLLRSGILEIALYSIPFMCAIGLMGIAVNLLQVGFLNVPELIKPKFERINPLEGFKRIFSKKALANLVKAILKVVVVGYVIYGALSKSATKVVSLGQISLPDAFVMIIEMISYVGVRIGFLLLFIGLIDYFYQWWEFEKSIRMSKQEIKDEYKQLEGDPLVRSRIRSRQRQIAQSRMMQAVPSADVIITNPTHVAVALSYEPEKGAPEVLAKGRGLLAQKIKDIARENDVPIVEKPELARAIYHSAEVGQFIPPELYKAVAEVLAFVYRLKRRKI